MLGVVPEHLDRGASRGVTMGDLESSCIVVVVLLSVLIHANRNHS